MSTLEFIAGRRRFTVKRWSRTDKSAIGDTPIYGSELSESGGQQFMTTGALGGGECRKRQPHSIPFFW